MKKSRKLVLHRETLHAMELRGVAGGTLEPTMNPRCNLGPSVWCNEGTYGECTTNNTYEFCSHDYCQTGGACTTGVTCSCP